MNVTKYRKRKQISTNIIQQTPIRKLDTFHTDMQRVEVKDEINLCWALLGFDFAFAKVTQLRGSDVLQVSDKRTKSASFSNLPPLVPQEAPPQLAPLLDLLISRLYGYSIVNTNYFSITNGSDTNLSHPAKAESQGIIG
ncbi:hypothetical protein Tco_0569396 [Tanacetum coccineum]